MPRSTKEKTPKVVKTFPVKKLPSLLKKTYTEKKLNKKILKKLYIPADKTYVKGLFKDAGTNKKGAALFCIPKDQTFTKKELSRLKKLTKEIKKQKGRFRIVPFIAAAGFIVALGLGFTLTKNIIAKKVITSSVESITGARCDVKAVDIKIIKSSFKLDGLEVANKNEPMKNLFSISNITFDFDLVQLLKAKFVVDEISVNGVEINSDRTYDGTLPPKKAKKIEKQKQKEKEQSPMFKELQEKSNASLASVQDTLTKTFSQYEPSNMLNNYYSNLKTPAMAQQVQAEITALTQKYTELPAKLDAEVKKAEEALTSVQNINFDELMKNPIELKSSINLKALEELQKLQSTADMSKPENITKALELTNKLGIKNPNDITKMVEVKPSATVQETLNKLNDTYKSVTDMKNQAVAYSNELQSDSKKATNLVNQIQTAIAEDTNYVQTEINKITSLTLDDGANFITGTLDSVLCQLLGKYYPYFNKATDYLADMKTTKKDKKATTTSRVRAAGRNVYYKKDTVPKVWIKKVAASGTDFAASIVDISSNMDFTGKPAIADAKVKIKGLEHKAKVTVDTRTTVENPLVTADYLCDSIPVKIPSSYFGDTPGIPCIENSNAALNCILKIFNEQEFSLEGKSKFTNAKFSTIAFEPAFVSDIYTSILSQINEMSLNFKTAYTNAKGLTIDLTSNIDKIFASALEKEIQKQLGALKSKVEAEVVAKLNEMTNGIFGEMNSLSGIQNQVTNYTSSLTNITNKVGNTNTGFNKQVNSSITSKQDELVKSVTVNKSPAQSQIESKKADVQKQTQNEVKNQLKKLF